MPKTGTITEIWNLLIIPNFEHYLPPTLSLLLKTPCTTFPQFRPLCHNCVQNLVFLSFFCHFWLFFWLFPTIQSLFKQNLSLNGNERQMRSKRSNAELYTFFPFRKKTLLKRFFSPKLHVLILKTGTITEIWNLLMIPNFEHKTPCTTFPPFKPLCHSCLIN